MDLSPDDADTLCRALIDLHANGDDAAGSRVAHAAASGELDQLLHGAVDALHEDRSRLVKKVITNHLGNQQTVWVSPDDTTPTHDHTTTLPAHQVLAGLGDALTAADPETARKPGVLAWAREKATTAAARVGLLLLRHHDAILAVGGLLDAVLDTPGDMKKFGYDPTASSGTSHAHATTADPVRAQLGISTHLAATIAVKVLSAGLTWLKGRGAKTEGDQITAAAAALHEILTALAEEFGLAPVPAVEVIAEHLRRLAG